MAFSAEVLVLANTELAAKLLKVADGCSKDIEANGEMKFTERSGSRDVGFMQATRPTILGYRDWLKTVGVQTRKQMEELWEQFLDNKVVCDSVEALKQAENVFNAISVGVNKILQQDEDAKVTLRIANLIMC